MSHVVVLGKYVEGREFINNPLREKGIADWPLVIGKIEESSFWVW
jgi:hypothetical protein